MRILRQPFLFLIAGLVAFAERAGAQEPQEPQEDFKVASVNVQQVFQAFYKTRKTEEQINEERIRIEKADREVKVRLKVLSDQIQKNREKIEGESVTGVSLEALKLSNRQLLDELNKTNKEKNRRYQQSNQQLNEEMVKTMRGILAEISRFTKEQAEVGGYDLVVDISGASTNQSPLVLYGRDMIDITATLIAQLNKFDPDLQKDR